MVAAARAYVEAEDDWMRMRMKYRLRLDTDYVFIG